MLEGAAKQSGWGVHERVMESDINVLLKLQPPERSITFSTVSSQTHTHARSETSHFEEVTPMLYGTVDK